MVELVETPVVGAVDQVEIPHDLYEVLVNAVDAMGVGMQPQPNLYGRTALGKRLEK